MSPIVPKLVKATLKKCSLSSAPGSDGITYLHLRKLPSAHHFGIIDISSQKGFLSGVNGTFEHIYASNSILDNAKAYRKPLRTVHSNKKTPDHPLLQGSTLPDT